MSKFSLLSSLLEARMGGKELASTLDKYGEHALVGFEFECYVSRNSTCFIPSGMNESERIDIDDLEYHQLEDYFYIDGTDHRKISRAYEEWLQKQDEDDELDEDAWIEYEFGSMQEFVINLRLTPTHGDSDVESGYVYAPVADDGSDDEDERFTDCATEVAHRMKAKLGLHEIKISSEPKTESPTVGDSFWTITTDGSLLTSDDQIGIEIISPPLPLSVALKKLDLFYAFCHDYDIVTDSSTGLHVNISIPGMSTHFDPLKLVVFLGETHLLKEFGRENNKYTAAHANSIAGMADLMKDSSFEEMKASVITLLKMWPKYRTVNFNKLHSGYLEFRILGGDYLLLPVKKITNTIASFVFACSIASNPEAEKQEYTKKLYKLLQPSWSVDKLAAKQAEVDKKNKSKLEDSNS